MGFVVSTLENLRTSTQMLMKLGQCFFRALLTCVPTFNNIHKYLIPFAYYFCSNINSLTCAIFIGEGLERFTNVVQTCCEGSLHQLKLPCKISVNSEYWLRKYKGIYDVSSNIISWTSEF